jgi:phosphatidate cytidylyltransferase
LVSNNRIIPGLIILTSTIFFYISNLDLLFINTLLVLALYDLKFSRFISLLNSFLLFTLLNVYFYFEYLINFENIFAIIFLLVLIISFVFKNKLSFIFLIILFFIFSYKLILIDREFFFILIAISFLNDTSAYLAGKNLGGPKIVPFISPNKTWSGTSVSFLITLITLILLKVNIYFSVILAISFFLGDIYFSYFKRLYKINDFSNLLYGHGGILDRLDSIFFASFLFYSFKIFI